MKSLSVVWEGNTYGDSIMPLSIFDSGDGISVVVQDLTSKTLHNYLQF